MNCIILHMPGFSGVDFLQTLKNPPRVVMTTSDTEFAIASYEYEMIIDYLVKPITAERFAKCVDKIKNSSNIQPKSKSNLGNEDGVGEDLYKVKIQRNINH